MSDFKAKMHQIRFWHQNLQISAPFRFPRWVAYSAPPDPIAGFKGPTSRGGEVKGREGGEERGKERRGEDGKGRGPPRVGSHPQSSKF